MVVHILHPSLYFILVYTMPAWAVFWPAAAADDDDDDDDDDNDR
jgi:hypothetical protein